MAEAITNQRNESSEQTAASNGQPNHARAVENRRGSQYIDMLLQRIQQLQGLERHPIIGVTSPRNRQGVSTIAANLAIRAADHFHEPVLLVDCNYRNQRTSRMYRCTGQGFGECYSGEANIEQCVRKTNITGLNVLGTGITRLARQIVVDPEISGSFFKDIRSNYRFCVLDCPKTGDPSAIDGMISDMDGILLVANYGIGKRELQEAQNHIVERGGNILGIIMTGDESRLPNWLPGFLR